MKSFLFNNDKFLGDYNNILSKALIELKYSIPALASPTLSKQETITFLFKRINERSKGSILNSIRNRVLFVYLLFNNLLYLFIVSTFFKAKISNNIKYYFRTWLVPKSINNKKITDDYFRDLLNDLSLQGEIVVGFQPQSLSSLLFSFKKYNVNKNFIIPIGLLSYRDIIKLLFNYVREGKVKIRESYYYENELITDYINQSLDDDYFKFRSFFAFLEVYITEKIIKFNPEFYIYIYENQAWEKSNLVSLNKTKIKTIGYQSSGFSYRFLNFFPTQNDCKTFLFPNQIYTVGDHYTNLLKNNAVYPDIIKTFCALRFNYLFKDNNIAIKKFNPKIFKRILYAFPVHLYQYEIIIDQLLLIFNNCDIDVILKFHPLHINYKYPKGFPVNFKIMNNIVELNQNYDLVLFNDNSYGLESLIEGVRSYQFEFGEPYPEDRLVDFNLYDSVVNISSCNNLRDAILNSTLDKTINLESLDKYIRNNFKPYQQIFNTLYF